MTAPNTPKGITTDDVVECLRLFIDENGYPPSVRQLGACLGLKSSSTANYWLNRLVAEGRIERVIVGPHTKQIIIKEEKI